MILKHAFEPSMSVNSGLTVKYLCYHVIIHSLLCDVVFTIIKILTVISCPLKHHRVLGSAVLQCLIVNVCNAILPAHSCRNTFVGYLCHSHSYLKTLIWFNTVIRNEVLSKPYNTCEPHVCCHVFIPSPFKLTWVQIGKIRKRCWNLAIGWTQV